MIQNKQSYSQEELEEMIAWFKGRELPKTMQIDRAAKTDDLALTVDCCIQQAVQNLGNFKMAGSFRILQKIRENLENE